MCLPSCFPALPVYTVEVGLPERVVRMDLASPKGFLWFHTLKSRGLNIR